MKAPGISPAKLNSTFRISGQSGSYFVLATMLTLMFLMLSALVFGSAVLATSRVRLKNLSNLAALSALNGYMRVSSSDQQEKSEAAVEGTLKALSQNSIPGAALGRLGSAAGAITVAPDISGESGYVEMGLWYPSKPLCSGQASQCNPCADKYPCFQPAASGVQAN